MWTYSCQTNLREFKARTAVLVLRTHCCTQYAFTAVVLIYVVAVVLADTYTWSGVRNSAKDVFYSTCCVIELLDCTDLKPSA